MRSSVWIIAVFVALGSLAPSEAFAVTASKPSSQIEVTADDSLEWYEDQGIYVARGNAKAIRGTLTVTADLLTAHKRDASGKKVSKDKNSAASGDIDRMTAEGNVLVTRGDARITADRAVDDLDNHVIVAKGDNLRYESGKHVVTARDSLEYWEESKTAVARGRAEAVSENRHIKADVLTAEFRNQPSGNEQLHKMTALGNVTVITKSDVVRGDKGVYDAARDIAIVTGHVSITRPDGTQLTGDVGEADFAANRSRLLNEGSGRVRALLPSKPKKASAKKKPAGGAS
ncbi:MAG: LptA/OstA family protein [Alphaproteobacteria bacterium]|nr:LptA/OstA family protein [Alphaproteobacteria bacterium]